MKKFTLILIWVMFLLYACVPVIQTSEPFQTRIPFTPTSSSTETPTPTEVVATPTEIGPKAGDTYSVTENGYTYEYTYNAELGQGVREVANFPLMDTPIYNYIPFKIFITDNTLNERNLLSISHVDWINNGEKINPLTSTFKPELEQRYFGILGNLNSASNEQALSLQNEMKKGRNSQAFLPIILSNGEAAKVKLSTETGLILTIMDKETLLKLGGERVSTWHYGTVTFYSEVYGVDEVGNELARLAFDDSIADIPSDVLRKILFTIPGNFVDHEDQKVQGFSDLAQGFALYSGKPREDGTQDVVFERVPVAQP